MIITKSIKEEIANNLLFYRKKSRLTQKELAEKIGVKHNAVSSWENGTNSIDIETLFNICKIFNVSINEIYGLKNDDINNTDNLITKKYNSLDEKGKHTVNTILEMEYNRCQSDEQATTKENDNLIDISIFPDEAKQSILHTMQVIKFAKEQPKNEHVEEKTLLTG